MGVPRGFRRWPGAIVWSLAFVLTWWLADSALDSAIFGETYVQELLHPGPRELVLRTVVAVAIFIFALMWLRLREADRQRELFAAVVEHAGDAVLWKDRRGRLLYANEAACQLFGYSRQELLTKNIEDIDPSLASADLARAWETLSRQKTLCVESVHRTKSGRAVPVEVVASYVKFGGREYNCSVIRDISSRNADREALRNSQDALLRAQRIARLGSFEWDIRNNTSEWSDEMVRLLGLEPGASPPTSEAFFEHIHPDDRARVEERFAADLEARRPHLSVHRLIQAGGTQIWVRCQGEFLLDADGNPVRMLGTLHDVTGIKRAEEELRERNRLKDLFTDILRHDLMNPAYAIKVGAGLLSRIESDAAKLDILRAIQHDATAMMDLCKNASQYAQVADVTKIEFGDYDLGTILVDVLASCRTQREERGATLCFDPEQRYPARVNPLIADVFANLVSNAIKYGPEGGAIDVSVRDADPSWCVRVADRGPGIPDADKLDVFNRFERLNASGVKGTGLGLAIARQLVELHHGRIWVENHPGGGSIFCVEVAKSVDQREEHARTEDSWPLGTRHPDRGLYPHPPAPSPEGRGGMRAENPRRIPRPAPEPTTEVPD
ncbi:MAG: PAS domain S-box protein [Myxococcales bacterium]|nr:PAS domain S-box protein [Myxococcales bacterium]